MDMLDSLINLPQTAVFGFVNDVDRKVYLSYSNELFRSISQKLMMYGMLNDYRNGKIRLILSPCSGYSKNALKLAVEQLQVYYEGLGYTFYHRNNYLRYTIKVYVEKDMLIYVYLVSRNYSKLIVGIFSKMSKANAFIETLKLNNPIVPVFALNALTKRHLLGQAFKRKSTSGQYLVPVKSKYNQIEDESDDFEY